MTSEEHASTPRQARDSAGRQPQNGLALHLSELSRLLHADREPASLFGRITATAVREISGADRAGISLLEQGHLKTRGATDRVVEDIEQYQYELDEGPCVASNRNARTIRADDLRDEPRWPRFAAIAVRLGVRSMLSVQLFDAERKWGALNLYAASPGSFDETAETIAILLASHAALAIAEQRDVADLRFALDVRDLVGQAKGILMERYQISAGEAFDLLAISSQNTNNRLTFVAEHLVKNGELLFPSRVSADD
jgi:GAF domain-containing protein